VIAAVTGASGHVGNTLCRKLIRQGNTVLALVHRDENDLERMGARIVRGDLLDKQSLENLIRDADVVFHLAAKIAIDERNRYDVIRTNVEGTGNIIEACIGSGKRRFIHFSSIHVFDHFPLDQKLDETRPLIGHSRMIYEHSKTESEKLVLEAAGKGLDAVVLTPTAIIGPYDFKPSLLGRALIQIFRNTLPMLVPGGYNWVDVRDVADAAISAVEKGRQGERYILSGTWLSLIELSQLMSEITRRKTPKRIVPGYVAAIGSPFISVYSRIRKEQPLYTRDSLEILRNSNRNISCKKASEELGYLPRPLEITLKDTFEWFKSNGFIES
jgi:dihydroflavonol-4-reductase